MRVEDVVAKSQIATRYGVSRQAVQFWSESTDWPAPIIVTPAQPLYDLRAVDRWGDVHGKHRVADAGGAEGKAGEPS